jgi:hypothetical protein
MGSSSASICRSVKDIGETAYLLFPRIFSFELTLRANFACCSLSLSYPLIGAKKPFKYGTNQISHTARLNL